MWDNIIIGTGKKTHSAVRLFSITGDHSISENNESFWIADAYLGIGMTIFKDTPEGIELEKYSKAGLDISDISSLLEDWVLKYADKNVLKDGIRRATSIAYIEGEKDNQAKIRAALGILGDHIGVHNGF